MKKPRHAALCACILLLFTGCSGDEKVTSLPAPHTNEGAPALSSETRVTNAWTLSFQAVCSGVENTQCPGYFGFSVSLDAHFEVGPGPSGQKLRGMISEAELKSLAALVTKAVLTPSNTETCTDKPDDKIREKVEFSSTSVAPLLITESNEKQFCHRLSGTDEANQLHATMRTLAHRYYPVPFPDTCINAAAALQNIYLQLVHCTVSSDCSYIDADLNPLPLEQARRILTDDCTVLTPLTVGNTADVLDQQRELLGAREIVRDACRASSARTFCRQTSGFDAAGNAPVCSAGVCTINPAVKVFQIL